MSSSAFQRSPSKVWWAQGLEDHAHHSEWHTRTCSGSPNSHKSQDSGFSDSEVSPSLGAAAVSNSRHKNEEKTNSETQKPETPKRIFTSDILPTDILKDISFVNDTTPKKNFKESIKEKYSPKKSITKQITDECLKKTNGQRLYEKRNTCCKSAPSTPRNQHKVFTSLASKSASEAVSPNISPHLHRHERLTLFNPHLSDSSHERAENTQFKFRTPQQITVTPRINESKSESRKLKPGRYSPKVNRNLLNYFPEELCDLSAKDIRNTTDDFIMNNNYNLHTTSLPNQPIPAPRFNLNATVPLYYDYNFKENHIDDEGITSLDSSERNDTSGDSLQLHSSSNEVLSSSSYSFQNDDLSDCEREVESFFLDKLDPPPHSSTPKVILKQFTSTPIIRIQRCEEQTLFEQIERVNPKLVPQIPSVQCWMNEVEQLYEPECMTTLQSKSIAMDLACHVSRMADNITAPIRDMMKHSRMITKEFNQIKTHILNKSNDHLAPLSQSLVGNITEFVLKYIVQSQSNPLHRTKNTEQHEFGVNKLLEIAKHLRQATVVSKPDIEDIENLISSLQDIFFAAEHNILALQIQLLVNAIEEPKSHIALRAVLNGITLLALQCERLSSLVVQAGGPRVLLILCVECKASTIRTMALRTLATVCCSTAAIRQLEKADGIEVLADILSDYNRPEPELSEATAVLAQITAPWIEDNHKVQGLAENIGTLIEAITDFLEKTKCCQNLLLCAAALANLTYMNLNTIGPLMQNNTLGKLLTAVRQRGPKASIFLKEQTATLIANLSDVPESRSYIADNNAAVALLCFLQIHPIHPPDEAHCNAAQRLQQKSAIALSRLCSDVEVAKQIVELGGLTRLTELCKEGRERNYSDAVLVACLATLRKIVANCGNQIMDQQDVMELVEPRLLDSFLAYSSQNESYV